MILNSPTISGSLTVTGNIITSGSITLSGSVASASYAQNATTAQTSSYANAFTVAGTLTAQTLVVQTITSSVDFVTGSTRFGSISGNTHQFTGSVSVSGSTSLVGALSGTSATFVSTAATNNAARYNVSIGDNSAVAAGNGGGILFKGVYTGTTLVDAAGISSYKANGTDGDYGYGLSFVTRANGGDLTSRLTISSTGAATFSSSVTATSFAMSAGSPYLTITSSNAARTYLVGVDSNGYIIYDNTASVYRMVLSPAGNLALGTTTPTNYGSSYTVLDVYNATAGGYILARGPNVTLQMGVETTLAYIGTATNHNLRLQTNGNTQSVITAGGNFLIGTTSDNGYKLQVAGSQYISSYLVVGSGGYVESPFCLNANAIDGNASFDVMAHITNTKYSSASSSGESRMVFGWSNHWGAALSAYKQGTNLTGFRFYGEQGYNAPAKVLEIDAYGYIYSPRTYNTTTAGAANMHVGSDGSFNRSTSSLKYKKNVENYTKGLAEVLQMRAVTYNSKNEKETQTYAGLIAEEIHDLGLTEFVQYAEDGTPDALAYQNMIALHTKAIQEMVARYDAKIEELKAEIDTLKNNQ